MKPKLLLIASCTERKSAPVPPSLQLRQVRVGVFPDRVYAWIAKLGSVRATTTPAGALYQGEHWATVTAAAHAATDRGFAVETWILSAGYGLISGDAPIKPYSATFAHRQADSVSRASDSSVRALELATWWSTLAGLLPIGGGPPRTLQALLARHPRSHVIVVASPSYLTAIREDFAAALGYHRAPGRISILSSASGSAIAGLAPFVVPVPARLSSVVGGSRVGLHAHAARELLQDRTIHEPDRESIRGRLSDWLRHAAPLPRYDRAKMTDGDVRAFVELHLRRDRLRTRSSLLRTLRDLGQACEQKRFSRLFGEVECNDGQ